MEANNSRATEARACFCVGPQNGDPVCPCQMPAYLQRQAERQAWEREQERIREIWTVKGDGSAP